MMLQRRLAFLASMTILSSAAPSGDVLAQQPEVASGPLVEEVVVSARKREESLSEVPLSVTAFSEARLDAIGFRGLEDVSVRTPGLQFSEQGGSIPGRYNCALRFRGMNVPSELPSYQLGALFIDGIYVLSGCHSLGAEDIQQVEVIKGPQAAYFGRNTFGGAVNYITRKPSSDFGMKVVATVAEKSDQEYLLSVEGPLLGEHLTGRLSARHYDKGPDYIATDGGELGARQTQSVGLTLASSIGDSFSARVRAFYGEDRDSAPVGGFISGNAFDTCSGTTGPNGEVRSRYICGTIPSIERMPANFLSHNTSLSPTGFVPDRPDFLRDVFVSNNWQATPGGALRSDPALDGALGIDDFGLKRNSFRVGASADYVLPNSWTITAVGSYNEVSAMWIRDYDLTDAEVWWSADPQDMRDASVELRMSAETERFDWLVGVSHYRQNFTGNGGGGTSVTRFPVTGGFTPQVFTNGLNNNDEIKNLGVFGGLTYRFNDQWNVSLEGRFQVDEMAKGQTAASLTGIPVASAKWETFLPRVILQWQPLDDTNIYLSYAKGVLPGDINSSYVYGTDGMRSPEELQSLRDQTRDGLSSRPDLGIPGGTPGISSVDTYIDEEEINSIELGWKQQWLDGRAHTAIAAYWMKWENQKGRSSAFIIDANGSTANPYVADDPLACMGQPRPSALPDGSFCDDVLRSVGYTIPGSSKIRGLELESGFSVTDALMLEAGVEWNHNEYTDYTFNLVELLAGTKDMTGNRAPRYPEWKGNLGATWNGGSVFDGKASWFARADLVYIGEYFVDESNLAKAPSQTLLDGRVGLSFDQLRVEFFGKNLTNETSWASAGRWSDFTIPGVFLFSANQGVAVSPQQARRFGIRLSYEF